MDGRKHTGAISKQSISYWTVTSLVSSLQCWGGPPRLCTLASQLKASRADGKFCMWQPPSFIRTSILWTGSRGASWDLSCSEFAVGEDLEGSAGAGNREVAGRQEAADDEGPPEERTAGTQAWWACELWADSGGHHDIFQFLPCPDLGRRTYPNVRIGTSMFLRTRPSSRCSLCREHLAYCPESLIFVSSWQKSRQA